MASPNLLVNAIHDIRSSDAIIVLGAGASYQAGMPLMGQLTPIVWHVVDNMPTVFSRLCSILGVKSTNAKAVIGDDSERITRAFECIASDSEAQQLFQECFCDLNRSKCKNASPAHDALARLIFTHHVIGILSLN